MRIPFHAHPTRHSKAVSIILKKKLNETECVFRFIHSPQRLSKAVSVKFKKKKPKRNVYSVSHFPHGLQKPFQKNFKKKKGETECVFRF